MPYVKSWNESDPAGSSAAAALDTAIQDTKIGVRERLEQIIPGFGDDGVNPKVLAEGTARVVIATEGTMPDVEFEGQELFTSDTKRMYVGVSVSPSEWVEVEADVPSFPRAFIIDAGSPEFDPDNNATRAGRVKAAILAAAASGGKTNVVYVPKFLWGYVADGDFNTNMFNPAILLVREGQLSPWYDPVAYGADATGNVDSAGPIGTCVLYARAPVSPGVRVVAFTITGTYRNDAVVDQGANLVTLIEYEGITHTGTGSFSGTWAWIVDKTIAIPFGTFALRPASGRRSGQFYLAVDTGKLYIWNGTTWLELNPTITVPAFNSFTYNADAGAGTRAAAVIPVKIITIRVFGTTNGTGQLVVDLAEAGFGAAYNLANLITVTASYRHSTGAAVEANNITIAGTTITLDVDGGTQTTIWDLVLAFSA